MSQEKNFDEKLSYAENTDSPHRMRLSIDIHSLKEAEFKGLIYVRYPAIPSIGIKQFKTLPAVEILRSTEGLALLSQTYFI